MSMSGLDAQAHVHARGERWPLKSAPTRLAKAPSTHQGTGARPLRHERDGSDKKRPQRGAGAAFAKRSGGWGDEGNRLARVQRAPGALVPKKIRGPAIFL